MATQLSPSQTPWMQSPDPCDGKSQIIRLVDIFALGPYMIYVGYSGKVHKYMRPLAIIGGFATIVYNYSNYMRQKNKQAQV
jgi:hypothetical protein